jgi:hypothetical protein
LRSRRAPSSSWRSTKAKPGTWPRLELNEDVDVALRTEVVAKHRAEERQLADVVPLAELGDASTVDSDLLRHRNS